MDVDKDPKQLSIRTQCSGVCEASGAGLYGWLWSEPD